MFDEKEEDKRVADYGQCPHNHQENETGKKNLKIQILSSMLKMFILYSTHPLGNVGRHSVGILKRKVFVNQQCFIVC